MGLTVAAAGLLVFKLLGGGRRAAQEEEDDGETGSDYGGGVGPHPLGPSYGRQFHPGPGPAT